MTGARTFADYPAELVRIACRKCNCRGLAVSRPFD